MTEESKDQFEIRKEKLEKIKAEGKNPYPNNVRSWCAIEFTCIHGSHKGQIRRVREPDLLRKND